MTILLYPNNNSNRFIAQQSVTANTTLTLSDKVIIYEGSDVATITLPAMNYYYKGTFFSVKNNSDYSVFIDTEDGETIDGELTQEIPSGDSISLVYISEWHII